MKIDYNLIVWKVRRLLGTFEPTRGIRSVEEALSELEHTKEYIASESFNFKVFKRERNRVSRLHGEK